MQHLSSPYTVRSQLLRDHTFKYLIKFSISVREGVWGLIFEFEGTSGGPCRELILSSRAGPPVNAACALLLLFVMAKAVAEAEAAFQLGTGLQEPGQGVHWRLELISIFTLKTT